MRILLKMHSKSIYNSTFNKTLTQIEIYETNLKYTLSKVQDDVRILAPSTTKKGYDFSKSTFHLKNHKIWLHLNVIGLVCSSLNLVITNNGHNIMTPTIINLLFFPILALVLLLLIPRFRQVSIYFLRSKINKRKTRFIYIRNEEV